MEIALDQRLQSLKLPKDELQSVLHIMLVNAASVDCGTVIAPDIGHAEFGESLAANLALCKRFSPDEVCLYQVILADYLRFCRQYIAESDVSEDGFDRQVYRSFIWAIRKAYKRGKKEVPLI